MKCISCNNDAGLHEGIELTICPSCSKKLINDVLRKYGR